MIKPYLIFFRFLFLIIFAFFLSSTGYPDSALQQLFEKKYAAWKDEAEKTKEFSSDPSGYFLDSFKEIKKLGLPALPIIINKMVKDAALENAVINISNRTLAPQDWVKVKNQGIVKFYLEWWNGGQKLAKEEFDERYAKWKEVNNSTKDSKELEKAMIPVERLGIAAFPYMFEKIASGEIEFIPVVSRITDGALPTTASNKDCLEWWKKNKNQWLIPFPDQNLWDK